MLLPVRHGPQVAAGRDRSGTRLAGRLRGAGGRKPIRAARLLTLGVLVLAAGHTAGADGRFVDSPYLEAIPGSGPCDAIVDASVAPGALESLLNEPGLRVFCVAAGDYRAAGKLRLQASGSEQARRFLRFDPGDGRRNAAQRAERALFEQLEIFGSWWVIQGLTIQPHDGATDWFVTIWGGDHNVLDGNLIDGIEHVPQRSTQNALMINGTKGDPATFNSVQGNVVRNGNQGYRPGDYEGINVRWGNTPGEDNDFNKILDNEVYDWGSGIAVEALAGNCNDPGSPHGTVIDGNDVYITGAKRIDCDTGAASPDGACACAEEGISVKAKAGADAALWTRITGNRTWGFRPTSVTADCGGSGANGQAITAGTSCARHVVVARNVVLDATQGITVAGSDWIVAGNLIHDTRLGGRRPGYEDTLAISPQADATEVVIEFNTVVDVDRAYDDMSADTDTRCNAVIGEADAVDLGGVRGTGHATGYNFLYAASAGNFPGDTNETFASVEASGGAPFCFWRKRWTSPERVCVPFASATAASPHEAAVAHCNPDLLAPFGLGPVSYPSAPVPEPAAGAGVASLLALGALAQRRARR